MAVRERSAAAGRGPVRLRPRVRQARRTGARLPRPKAICPECGTVSIYSEHINRRCAKQWEIEGEDEPVRCEGRFRGAVAPDRWAACPDCGATGMLGDAPCPPCGATGWRYIGEPGRGPKSIKPGTRSRA
jgi:hypothetical protein